MSLATPLFALAVPRARVQSSEGRFAWFTIRFSLVVLRTMFSWRIRLLSSFICRGRFTKRLAA